MWEKHSALFLDKAAGIRFAGVYGRVSFHIYQAGL